MIDCIMEITVEISLYPLNENFKEIIKEFILNLNKYKNISIVTNNVSTQISGEYNIIMDILKNEIKNTFEKNRSVLVAKFLIGNKLSDNQIKNELSP